ncbi:TetR/AcrR family transcriptional regulator, partial [Rhizobium johnstonii]|uniref:TetR/AcrR family transcriptional regulator n=1 Tax=Rhizobium johnstonii TaxID=3019933 RepID=UPI003F9845DC
RAKPLSRDDRRNAIMEAIVPLIVAHGRSVTSKQIAEAAGVAEGTIYSVFADKDELLEATVHHHLERASMAPKIDELPPGFPLAEV